MRFSIHVFLNFNCFWPALLADHEIPDQPILPIIDIGEFGSTKSGAPDKNWWSADKINLGPRGAALSSVSQMSTTTTTRGPSETTRSISSSPTSSSSTTETKPIRSTPAIQPRSNSNSPTARAGVTRPSNSIFYKKFFNPKTGKYFTRPIKMPQPNVIRYVSKVVHDYGAKPTQQIVTLDGDGEHSSSGQTFMTNIPSVNFISETNKKLNLLKTSINDLDGKIFKNKNSLTSQSAKNKDFAQKITKNTYNLAQNDQNFKNFQSSLSTVESRLKKINNLELEMNHKMEEISSRLGRVEVDNVGHKKTINSILEVLMKIMRRPSGEYDPGASSIQTRSASPKLATPRPSFAKRRPYETGRGTKMVRPYARFSYRSHH